ncbi:MAG: hypothetical protein OEU44_08515, partial [Gammaproteobacteria bacterium]|nr:hypothetical protein [Gammaproteobacteria bacterium]
MTTCIRNSAHSFANIPWHIQQPAGAVYRAGRIIFRLCAMWSSGGCYSVVTGIPIIGHTMPTAN